jgi:hypothetical protein
VFDSTGHVVESDARTGRVAQTLDFPTHNKRRNSIYAPANDTLLVAADDQLRVVSPGRESFALLTPGHGCFIHQSVSGKGLLITDYHGQICTTARHEDGSRIAIPVIKYKGGSSLLDISPTPGSSDFGFRRPVGKQLAVLYRGVFRVFRVIE